MFQSVAATANTVLFMYTLGMKKRTLNNRRYYSYEYVCRIIGHCVGEQTNFDIVTSMICLYFMPKLCLPASLLFQLLQMTAVADITVKASIHRIYTYFAQGNIEKKCAT